MLLCTTKPQALMLSSFSWWLWFMDLLYKN